MCAATLRGSATEVDPAELEAVVAGTRMVAALIAESLANLDPAVTVPQWRVLVLARAGACNVTGVAQDLGIHVSNATRTCDRLVAAGLLERRRADRDRRQVLLALTPAGQRLFDAAMKHRRARLGQAMALMEPEDRAQLARTMTRLVEADEQASAPASGNARGSAPDGRAPP